MQVQFARNVSKSQGLLSSKTSYSLEVVLMPTDSEQQLLEKHGFLKNRSMAICMSDPAQSDIKSQFVSFEELRGGMVFTTPFAVRIQEAEKTIMLEIQSVLGTCEELETFNGAKRVMEVTSTNYGTVAVS